MIEEEFEPKPAQFRPEVLQELTEAGWFNSTVPNLIGALCADAPNPDAFFTGRQGMAEAMALCDACPVRKECGDWAKQSGQKHGIWGGEFVGRKPYEPVERCLRNHDEWRFRPNGKRYCGACQRIYKQQEREAA